MKRGCINIVFRFRWGPWGGGNQFLKALKNFCQSVGFYCRNPRKADVILFNSHHNLDKVLEIKKRFSDKIFIHRVDGPITMIRNDGGSADNLIFKANSQIADATIFQSFWSRNESHRLGMPVKKFETVILNAPDSSIFNGKNKSKFNCLGKIKIAAASWSSGEVKGFDIYKYLDENLDFNKFEMVFIGNSPIKFRNIKLIPPVRSKKLAKIFKASDLFITASRNDPCSNVLIEAMHCGLPAVARNSGGHPEIVKQGGILFDDKKDVISAIEKVASNYHFYQSKIQLPTIEEVGAQYLEFIKSTYI